MAVSRTFHEPPVPFSANLGQVDRDPDDAPLVAAWAAGEAWASRALVERHFDGVYRFFAGKVATGVEDLVQDTFAACLAARDRAGAATSFRAYLFGIARNKLLRYYRDRRKLVELSDVAETRLVDLEPGPSSWLADKREERILLEALRRLTIDHQIVIELYAWERLSGLETAEVLGITEAAMRSRLHRAKLQLRDEIAALAQSPELLESTLVNLDAWAAGLRARRI